MNPRVSRFSQAPEHCPVNPVRPYTRDGIKINQRAAREKSGHEAAKET